MPVIWRLIPLILKSLYANLVVLRGWSGGISKRTFANMSFEIFIIIIIIIVSVIFIMILCIAAPRLQHRRSSIVITSLPQAINRSPDATTRKTVSQSRLRPLDGPSTEAATFAALPLCPGACCQAERPGYQRCGNGVQRSE